MVSSVSTNQTASLNFVYVNTDPGSCPFILIHDVSLVGFQCDSTCASCNFITSVCSCSAGHIKDSFEKCLACISPC